MARGDWARSFRRNEGRRTRAQRRALRTHWESYGLRWKWDEQLDLDEAFGCRGSTWLDIGFGTGTSTVGLAEEFDDYRVLAIEVYRPGLGALLLQIVDNELSNVRVVRGDVFELLTHHLPDDSIDRASVYFPEPWPDAPERRIVRPLLLELLEAKMTHSGVFFVATDVADYARHIEDVAARCGWNARAIERPTWRPYTVYEEKAESDGREVFDFELKMTEVTAGG